jgi:hypothetical protein
VATPETKSSADTDGSSSGAESPLEFPSEIPLKHLLAQNAEYNPIDPNTKIGLIQKHEDLYEGGRKFRAHIRNYLIKRNYESGGSQASNNPNVNPKAENVQQNNKLASGGGSGEGCYDQRVKRAWYTPLVAGIIDFMVSAVFQNPPAIVAAAPATGDKKTLFDSLKSKLTSWIFGVASPSSESAYWHQLNRNADGKGRDLAAILRAGLLEVMLHKRAYLMPTFPESNATTVQQQKEQGGLDAKICLLKAADVDDWQYDDDGNLVWIRIHRCEMKRSNSYGQPDTELHRWTFITANAVYRYQIEWKQGEHPKEETPVFGDAPRYHDIGRLPVVPIRIPEGLWVMDRLSDTALSLFNRQSAATWTLDQMAFCLLVVASQKQMSDIIARDITGLHLNPTETATFTAPPAAIFDAQQKDIDRLKEDLFLAIQAMVLVAAAKDEQGRQSGVAKQRDFGTLTTLLEAFAGPVRDAIEEVVEMIRTERGDQGLVLAVQGLDKFDVQSLELKLKNAAAFLSIQDIPESAKTWTILDTSLAMTSNAPAEVREAVVQELMQRTQDAEKKKTEAENNTENSGKSSSEEPVEIRQSNTQTVK